MPKRDIESLGVMGWGLVAAGNSSAAVVVAVAVAAVPWGGGDFPFFHMLFLDQGTVAFL